MSGNRVYKLRLLLAALFLVAGTSSQANEDELRIPDFSMADLKGEQRSITEWEGKAMLINFWASWCIPCKREIPMLNKLSADYAGQDFQVLGIAVDKPENIREFIQSTPLDYVTLVDEDKSQELAHQISNSFLVLPFTVFVDHQGRIFWMQVEEMHRKEIDVVLNRIRQIQVGEMDYDEAQVALISDLKMLYQQGSFK